MIDIQKIETFLCAAENTSLLSATRQLHLSQPAITIIGELSVCNPRTSPDWMMAR